MKKLMYICSFIVMLLIVFGGVSTLVAQDCASDPYQIPAGCPDDYTVDFNCTNRRLIDPTETCCVHKCKGTTDSTNPEAFDELEVFGFRVAIDAEKKIPLFVNLAITTFLAIVSLYAVIMGIYYAGIKRAQATTEEEITKINLVLRQLIIGFTLAWAFIFIVQFIFNLLGLGSLNDMIIIQRVGEASNDSITIV